MSQAGRFPDDSALPDIEFLLADNAVSVGPDAAFTVALVGGANVTTFGDAAANTVTINVAGAAEGTGQTIGAVTDDVITFPLGVAAGAFVFHCRVIGFEATTPAACGYEIVGTVRTTGIVGTVVSIPVITGNEDIALGAANATIVAVGNDAIIRVTGVGGLTIDWHAETDSLFQG